MIGLSLASCCVSAGVAAADRDPLSSDRDLLAPWHGVWRGVLEDAPVPLDPSPNVQFTVDPGADDRDGCLVWRSEYILNGVIENVKDYELCRESDHFFRLEEGGGVFLNISVFGDDMYSAFALTDAEIALFTHTHREGDVIVQDIYSTKGADEPVSGLSAFIGVKRQRLILKRDGEF
ncbi:hypothetical protein CW354_16615 [Marinicaulis flavus]|uniref:Uncharacterized protein n=1 Tax=Hyphococcus luteus TaxID=2058213 RepID=A0A2S7K0H7_9PROT|nr:hypothetical protein CW354_16615 [Marinicaulis flavus]